MKKNHTLFKGYTWPGCLRQYNGKTNRFIIRYLNEHATREDQTLHQHLTSYRDFNYLVQLFTRSGIHSNGDLVDQEQHITNAVMNNTIIFDANHIWSQLASLEA